MFHELSQIKNCLCDLWDTVTRQSLLQVRHKIFLMDRSTNKTAKADKINKYHKYKTIAADTKSLSIEKQLWKH